MKNLGKVKAILISSIIAFVMVAGLALTFIPVTLGSKDYESFAGALRKSTSIDGGMSVEYEIKSDSTDKEISESINILTGIISEYGFKSVTAYKKGDNKIHVDLNEPVLVTDRSATEDFLTNLSAGRMQFKTKDDASATMTPKEGEEVDETLVIIEVNKHVEKISKINSRGANGIQIDFNKEGKSLYSKATGYPLYMFVDGEEWPNTSNNEISANTDSSATSMYMMFNSADVVDSYYYVLRAGTMSIELDADSVEISYNENKTATAFKVAGIVLTIVAVVGLMVLLAIKFKGFSIAPIVSSLIGLSILMFLLQAMNWVVFGFSSLIAIVAVAVITYIINAIIFSGIKEEYSIGKSLATATEDGFKKHTMFVVDTLCVTFIVGLILAITSAGELVGVGTILALSAVILALNTLLFNRLILNCLHSFNENGTRLFGLAPHEQKEEN